MWGNMMQTQYPKCKSWLEIKLPRGNKKSLKGVKIICSCGYKSECIDWNEYISRLKEVK